MRRQNYLVFILSAMFALSSCGADIIYQETAIPSTTLPAPTTFAVTQTISLTPVPPTHTPTATLTPHPTRDPLVPTPNFPASQVATSLILSAPSYPDCQFPCWHGLEVGVSNRTDVEAVLNLLFLPDDSFDFFASVPSDSIVIQNIMTLEGAYTGGHVWEIKDLDSGIIGWYLFATYIDSNTGQLTGITESIHANQVFDLPSIPYILETLGPPDWIYGGFSSLTFIMTFLYKSGIRVGIDILPTETQDGINTVCFNRVPIIESYRLVDPIDYPDEDVKSLLRQNWPIPDTPAPYIDEIYGLASIDEFVDLVYSSNPCLEIVRE